MNRLQARLMLSFSVVLLVTLVIIGVTFIAFLRSTPLPLDSLLNELAVTSLQTDFRDYIDQQRTNRQIATLDVDWEALNAFLDESASQTDYRLLIIRNDSDVLYDSADTVAVGGEIPLGEKNALQVPSISNTSRVSAFFSGEFVAEDGQIWVYVGRGLLNRAGDDDNFPPPPLRIDYIVATPRPEQTLATALAAFNDSYLLPLLQAGFIGIVIALILSVWLSRSVARPLQAVALAANKVAKGDYSQQVPVTGPTEAQIVAQAFNEMTEQVKLNQQAQHDFLANVTHDLRTPLTSIQGFSQAIMDGVAADPEIAQNAAQIIYEESGRLTRLVSELLDLAKIQAGRLQMMRHAVELALLLARVGESMSIKAKQKGVKLHVKIGDIGRIAGDGDRLAQVFTNLVDNAIKHTDEGGQVWLMAKPHENGILVQIQDTGEGIPADDLTRIFERFYQVDKSRNRHAQHHGAGLGLAITKEIIVAHSGKIWAESQVGVGSRFNIWLPMMAGDQTTLIQRRLR